MNCGADDNYYYFYEAIDADNEGKSTDYKVVAKVPHSNQKLIKEWQNEVRKNNERNRIETNDSSFYESVDEFKSTRPQYRGDNTNVFGGFPINGQVGGLDGKQHQRNGERNNPKSGRDLSKQSEVRNLNGNKGIRLKPV